MLQFHYKAIDKEGKRTDGRVEATNPTTATHLLQDRGLFIINLTVDAGGIFSFLGGIRRGIGLGEVSAFTRQFATMISAGVTITESLSILKDQVSNRFSPIIEQILVDVEAGASLSGALEKHPTVFSPVYIALIRSGETGGILDEVLLRLADNLEKEQEFRSKVIGALIYPAIVIAGMFIVALIMMLFVIPRLATIYTEFKAELPITTRILIGISGALTQFWWIFVILLFGLFWGITAFTRTPFGKEKLDRLMLKIPIFGKLRRQIMLTEFTRTLGLLVGAGVSILEALNVVSKITNNMVLSSAIEKASSDVEKGFPLAWALGQREDAFPHFISRMIAVGEETGKLNEVLGKTSHILEVESEAQVRTLTAAVEPLIMVVLGVGVGFLVISIILPIYNITSHFGSG